MYPTTTHLRGGGVPGEALGGEAAVEVVEPPKTAQLLLGVGRRRHHLHFVHVVRLRAHL